MAIQFSILLNQKKSLHSPSVQFVWMSGKVIAITKYEKSAGARGMKRKIQFQPTGSIQLDSLIKITMVFIDN